MLRKIILFALAAVFLVSGALPAASPDPASEWRRAEMLLLDRKASEAYPVFFNLLQRYPGHSSLMLGLARSAALTGRYDEAGRLYRDLLMKFPDDPVLLNESDQVRGLRAGTASPTTVNFRMRAGVIYDSNANQGAPDDLILDLGGWRLVVDDTKRIGTFGGYFGANFNLSRRFSDSSPWSLVADSGLYIRGNEDSDLDDIKSSEWQWFRAGAGLRYAQGRNLFEFRVKGEVFDYEFTNHVYAWGPELTYLRAVTPTFHLISQLSVDWREYQRNPGRDGHYGQLAQYGRFFFGDNT
ncbi:MAG: tetratricopeptide repeat protein, partial [Deltaproteobacteria bacterium]|nr:tetratricopeptide repeat protein [Deltaproteobacteria bacterium]